MHQRHCPFQKHDALDEERLSPKCSAKELNPKTAGGAEELILPPPVVWPPLCGFNVIISHTFPKNLIQIPQVVQKLCRISLSRLAIFVDFLDFLTYPCYKETTDVNL